MTKFSNSLKLKKKTKYILVIVGILLLAGIILGLSGYFGGGGKIPEDTFTQGLVGYWSFDEGVGNIAYDASGNDNHAQISTCGGTIDYGGQTYNMVQIGTQCWLQENLNIGNKLATGSTMPSDPFDYDNIEKWCYDNDDGLCATDGGLYTWAEAMGFSSSCLTTDCSGQIQTPYHRGICPSGWHIPTDNEWYILTNYLSANSLYWCGGESTYIAKSLASTDAVQPNWSNSDTLCYVGNERSTNNTTGLTVLPAGRRYTDDSFYGRTYYALLWSASQNSGTNAWHRYLDYYDATVLRDSYVKANGFSVRCVKDTSVPAWTTGKVGGALSFDGVDDYALVSHNSTLDITNAITIETWAKQISSFFSYTGYINATSNIDSVADIGSHSDFTKQKTAPDSVYDTLTEANIPVSGSVPVIQDWTVNDSGGNTVTSITLTKPTGGSPPGVQVGDLLILIAGSDDDNTATFEDIAGWNKIVNANNTDADASLGIYWRIADGTENATIAVSIGVGNANEMYGWYIRVSGVDQTNPINVVGTPTYGTDDPFTINQVETTFDNCLAFYAVAFDGGDAGSFTPSGTGWNEIDEQYSGTAGTDACGTWGIKNVGSKGLTGNVSVDLATADGTTRVQFAVTPTLTANYRLELEEQFTNIPYQQLSNPELHVVTGTSTDAETLSLQVWSGGSWVTLGQLATSTDNSFDISDYATSTNLYIRFIDGTQSSDTTQSSWQKDSVWIESGAAPPPGKILSKGQSVYSLEMSGFGSIKSYINDNEISVAVSTSTDWHQYVMTYDGSNQKLYIDGILATSTSLSGSINTTTTALKIGELFNGTIDELRLYNRALSEAEVRFHYNRGGPVMHLQFDEGSGDTAYDSSGNENHGVVFGATSTAGKYGTALSFNGVGDYVEVFDSASLDITKGITLSAWAQSVEEPPPEVSPEVKYKTQSRVRVDSDQTSITIPAPPDFQADDLLIAIISKDGTGEITPPGGNTWNTIQATSSGASYTGVYYRIAQAGDTSWTWTGASEEWIGVILRYAGHSTTTPIYNSALAIGSSNTPTAPSVSFTDLPTGSLALQLFGADHNDTPYTIPSPLIERFSYISSLGNGSCGEAGGEKPVSGTGSTGTAQFTMSATEEWVAVTIVINASAEGPYSSEIFSDGFENGDFSAWDDFWWEGGTTTVVSDNRHHGTYSFKSDIPSAGLNKMAQTVKYLFGTGYVTWFVRFYVKFNSLDNVDGYESAIATVFADDGGMGLVSLNSVGVKRVNGTWRWHIYYYDSMSFYEDDYLETEVNTGIWYSVELKTLINDIAGEVRMYVDGNEIFTKTGLSNDYGFWSRLDAIEWLNLGKSYFIYNNATTTSGYALFDCVLVTDSYIGPEEVEKEIILSKGEDAYALETSGDGSTLYGYINNNEISAGVSTPDIWHHYVLSYDSSNQKLYIDGRLITTSPLSGDINMTTSTLKIGRFFSGMIDDVRIYNYARTPDEVRLDYNAGYAARFGPASSCERDPGACMNLGLVGYWNLDEGGGNIAYDSSGMGNHGQIWFCGDTINYGGQTYNTVQIGNQCWLQENLNIGNKLATGSTMPSDPFDYDNIEKWCYNNDDGLCATDGGLYTWAEAMGFSSSCLTTDCSGQIQTPYHRGICPSGWHIPTDDEWYILTNYLSANSLYWCDGESTYIAKSLASTDAVQPNWSNSATACHVGNNRNTNNTTGLTVLPAGDRLTDGSFNYRTYNADLWSASQGGGTYAWLRTLLYSDATVYRYSDAKAYGFSVRCLRDDIVGAPSWTSGKVGGALSFDGVADYVEVTVTQTKTTYSFWMKPSGSVWQHIVKVNSTYYINGVATSSPPSDFPIYVSGDTVQIGKTGTSTYFNGMVDEVRIYSRALSEFEISYLFNGGRPIAHWRFDEGSGNIAYDSGQPFGGNNGTIYGATWVSGKYGTALSFSGGGDYVEATINQPTTTISLWVQNSGVWEHVVNVGGTYYVNGMPGTPTSYPIDISGSTIQIGKFSGLIDDVRIYNYARTEEQIKQDYNEGMAARFGPTSECDRDPGACMTQGLVGYWNFDEGNSKGLNIMFADGFDDGTFDAWTGTVGGPPVVSTDYTYTGTYSSKVTSASWQQEYVQKDLGSSKSKLYFRQYVLWTSGAPLNGDDDGLGVGFVGSASDTPRVLVNVHNTGGTYFWALRYMSGVSWYTEVSTKTVTASNTIWHNVEVYVSNTVLKLWVDGELVINLLGLSCGTNWRYVAAGTYWNNGSGNFTIYNDSIVVSDSYIGPDKIAYDTSGNENNGIVLGATSVRGKHSSALSFDGVNDYVEATITQTKTTYSFWMKPSGSTWQHIVKVNSNYYINGVATSSPPSYFPIYVSGNIVQIGKTGTSTYFNGMVDEVRIYNRALSETEVRYHYNRGAPIGHWKFDEGSGTTTYDSSGQDNHGEIIGTTYVSYVEGKYGSALSFNGIDAYVSSTLDLSNATTFEAWIKNPWLTGWSYRKGHVINSAAGAGSNYQIKIKVNYGSGSDSGENVYLAGKCRTDFGDIRFTDDDKQTLLDYWMEQKVDEDYAIFWVKVADNLSTQNQTIYVYYGNSSATSISDGNATFLFFDDFNTLDTDKWTVYEHDGGTTISVSGGNLLFTHTTGYLHTGGNLISKETFSGHTSLMVKSKISNMYASAMGAVSGFTNETWSSRNTYYGQPEPNITNNIRFYDSPYETISLWWFDVGVVGSSTEYYANIWFNIKTWINKSSAARGIYTQLDSPFETKTLNLSGSCSWDPVRVLVGSGEYNTVSTYYFDWVALRKALSDFSEPTHGGWGQEATYTTSDWQHLAKVSSTYYINGSPGNPSVFPIYISGNTVQIGKDENGDFVSGIIDDVRIYNYARNQEQILQDYNAGFSTYFR